MMTVPHRGSGAAHLATIWLSLLALAATLCSVASAQTSPRSQAELKRLFPYEATITTSQTGLVRLVLPPEVLTETRPDLSDLRVFDARDAEVAFLVDSGQRKSEELIAIERFEGRVLSLRREEREFELAPTSQRETYEIEAPPQAPESGHWDLVFEVRLARFVREVTISAVESSGDPDTLVMDAPLFRVDGKTERSRITLPAFRATVLRIEIEGTEGSYLKPTFRFESARRLDARDQSVVPLEELSRESRDGKTLIELARPGGIVPDVIRIETATGSFSRKLTVWDEQPGRSSVRLGADRVSRVATRDRVEQLDVKIRQAGGSTLRISIDDGDSPPLEAIRFSAVVRRPVLIFELPADARGSLVGTLRFGGGRAHRPRYDLLSLLLGVRRSLSGESAEAAIQLYDPKALPAVQLGSIRPNRSFDVTPALAFAMHPAAGIDERVYSHRRKLAIDPSVEGLSRLRLAPEDVAQSRADLADLRLVDADSQQWPYLMKRDARSQNAEIVVRDSSSSKRKTTYELAPPVAPLRIDQLTFKSQAPFFDRAYRLVAIDQDGRKRELARGRLVKRARSPQPVRIAFERQPTHALELIVEDGDDAPLRFDSVESRVWLPELFLVAPKGDYALLIGNPDAQRPRYELERVRNVVLAVSSNPVTVGPLAQNRRYSLTARLGAGDGTTGLVRSAAVWAVLLLAVAVLAVLTFRIARQEPEGEAPRESSDA